MNLRSTGATPVVRALDTHDAMVVGNPGRETLEAAR